MIPLERLVGEDVNDDIAVRGHKGKMTFLLADPGGLAAEEHPFAVRLAGDVAASDVEVIAFSVP